MKDHINKTAVPLPPDGGWGWMVALGASMYWFIMPSINRSVSLLYESWLQKFETSAQVTSGIFSTYLIISQFSGPLCAAFVIRFGNRTAFMLGGVLCTAGLVSSAFAPSVLVIYFTFGVFIGLGRGLVELTQDAALTAWFKRHRAKVSGMVAASTGVGTLAIAPLLQYSLDEYGSGALLVLACLALHIIAGGALMRNPDHGDVMNMQNGDVINKQNDDVIHVQNGDVTHNKEHKEDSIIQSGQTEAATIQLTDKSLVDEIPADTSLYDTSVKDACTCDVSVQYLLEKQDRATNNVKTHSKDCKHQYLNVYTGTSDDLSKSRAGCCSTCSTPNKYIDWKLFKSIPFLSYCMMMGSTTLSVSLLNTHFAGVCTERGVDIKYVALLISATGPVLLITRLVAGFLFDLRCLKSARRVVLALLVLVMAATHCIMAFTTTPAGLLAPWVVFIIAQCIVPTQQGVVLLDVIGKSGYTSALGIMKFCRGFGFVLGPTMGGYFYDKTGNYFITFLYSGLMTLGPALIFLIVMLYRQYQDHKHKQSKGSSSCIS